MAREPVDLATTVAAVLAGLQPEAGRLGIHVDEMTRTGAPRRRPPARRTARAPTCSPTPSATTLPAGRVEVVTGVTRRPGRPVGDQHRTAHPASGSRPSLPALPAARSAPGTSPGRARARAFYRPGHRDRPRRHHHRPPRTRRRPVRERHLPATREPGRRSGTSFPERPTQPRDRDTVTRAGATSVNVLPSSAARAQG